MGKKSKIIPHIPATLEEIAIAVLQPNYNRVRTLDEQRKKKSEKNNKNKKMP